MNDQNSPETDMVPVTFAEMNMKDKAETGLRIASDYMLTVKARLDKVETHGGLSSLDRMAFETQALRQTDVLLSSVREEMLANMQGSADFEPEADADKEIEQYQEAIQFQDEERLEQLVGELIDKNPEMKNLFDSPENIVIPQVNEVLRNLNLEDDRISRDLADAYYQLKIVKNSDTVPDLLEILKDRFYNSARKLVDDYLRSKYADKIQTILGEPLTLQLTGDTHRAKLADEFLENEGGSVSLLSAVEKAAFDLEKASFRGKPEEMKQKTERYQLLIKGAYRPDISQRAIEEAEAKGRLNAAIDEDRLAEIDLYRKQLNELRKA